MTTQRRWNLEFDAVTYPITLTRNRNNDALSVFDVCFFEQDAKATTTLIDLAQNRQTCSFVFTQSFVEDERWKTQDLFSLTTPYTLLNVTPHNAQGVLTPYLYLVMDLPIRMFPIFVAYLGIVERASFDKEVATQIGWRS